MSPLLRRARRAEEGEVTREHERPPPYGSALTTMLFQAHSLLCCLQNTHNTAEASTLASTIDSVLLHFAMPHHTALTMTEDTNTYFQQLRKIYQ